jgi:predicted transposase YbfD/YdcC
VKAAHVSGLDFPHACQAIKITRWRKDTAAGKVSRETAYAVTSLTSADATTPDLARLVREHWSIEAHHHISSPGTALAVASCGADATRVAFGC